MTGASGNKLLMAALIAMSLATVNAVAYSQTPPASGGPAADDDAKLSGGRHCIGIDTACYEFDAVESVIRKNMCHLCYEVSEDIEGIEISEIIPR